MHASCYTPRHLLFLEVLFSLEYFSDNLISDISPLYQITVCVCVCVPEIQRQSCIGGDYCTLVTNGVPSQTHSLLLLLLL